MDCWTIGDEGLLVRFEEEQGCGSAPEAEAFLLLDAWGDIDRIFEATQGADDEGAAYLAVHYEVEDGVFCRIVEEGFSDGRTNYDREIELEDLHPLTEEDSGWPDEEGLRAQLGKHRKN